MGPVIGWSLIVFLVYQFFYPYIWKTEQVRYRVNVAIDTPKGLKIGSGVWGYSEGARFDVPVYSFKWSFSQRLEGEAFPIILDNGKIVYTVFGNRIISTEYGVEGIISKFFDGYTPFEVLRKGGLGSPDDKKDDWAGARERISWLKGQQGKVIMLNCAPARHIDSSDCPALVQVVKEPPRPLVRLLDVNRLDQAFGSGTKLRSMTLEIVDAPITHGIERLLPWLDGPTKTSDPLSSSPTETEHIIATGFRYKDPTRF